MHPLSLLPSSSVGPLTLSPWLLLFLLVAAYWTCLAIYRLFLSPLHAVPGPWYAAVSDFWITTHILRLRRCRAIHDLLAHYGPVVRVAPNTVVFNDVRTYKDVYGVKARLSKSTFYKSLMTNGNDHAMTTLDHAQHAMRKRGYFPHYTPANLQRFQPDFHDLARKLVDLLHQAAASSSSNPQEESVVAVDTLLLFRHLFIDVNCVHLFHYNARSLHAWAAHVLGGAPPDETSTAIADFPKRGLLNGALPRWMWRALEWATRTLPVVLPGHRRWLQFCDSSDYLGEFVQARLEHAKSRLSSSNEEELDDSGRGRGVDEGADRVCLLDRLLKHNYTSPVEREESDSDSAEPAGTSMPMPDRDIVSECIGHLIAGTDTTSTTLSYILWELSRRRDVLVRLQEELDAVWDDEDEDEKHVPDIGTLQRLPVLTAVIKEGLRVYTAAPSPLERVVPYADTSSKSKNVNSSPQAPEFKLLGYAIPGGTVIGSQSWTSHRDPRVFEEPDAFRPERWLVDVDDVDHGDGDTTAQMNAQLFPFGFGPRVCGGQNLAQAMLRVVVAAVVRAFEVHARAVPGETDERGMEVRDSFVIFPAAMECKLVFVPRVR